MLLAFFLRSSELTGVQSHHSQRRKQSVYCHFSSQQKTQLEIDPENVSFSLHFFYTFLNL